MKKLLLAAVGTAALFAAAAPAQSAILVPGLFTAFSPFDTTTQGEQLASMADSGIITSTGFAGTLRSAVWRNTDGTLDFYYQVVHNAGPAVQRISAFSFGTHTVSAFFWDADPDGTDIFTAENNGGNTALESTATRSSDGKTVGVNFQAPPGSPFLMDAVGSGETSSTYIFRTDATGFGVGTGGVIDGGAFSVNAFAPVPEPSTWAMMLVGFGAVGYSMRRRPKYRLVQAV